MIYMKISGEDNEDVVNIYVPLNSLNFYVPLSKKLCGKTLKQIYQILMKCNTLIERVFQNFSFFSRLYLTAKTEWRKGSVKM